MPPFVRAVAMILIGIPGGFMWLAGMLCFIGSCWALGNPDASPLEAIIGFGASVISTAIGFTMVACAEMLNGAKRYRMPRARLLPYLGLELLEGLLAVAIVAVALVAMSSFGDKKSMTGVVWTLFEAIIVLLLVTTHRALQSKGKTWRAELASSPTVRA
jgi:heme/copper-type cytochrome/quinol oxidase subunit 4